MSSDLSNTFRINDPPSIEHETITALSPTLLQIDTREHVNTFELDKLARVESHDDTTFDEDEQSQAIASAVEELARNPTLPRAPPRQNQRSMPPRAPTTPRYT